jgi:hypothetical protein
MGVLEEASEKGHEGITLGLSSDAEAGEAKVGVPLKEEEEEEEGISHEEQRAIIRKIDCRLLPVCGLLLAICLVDRGNLGNASIAG